MPYYPPQPEKPSGPPDSGGSSRRRNILRWMAIGAFAVLIVYGAGRLISYGSDLIASRQTARELREIAAETDTLPNDFFPPSG